MQGTIPPRGYEIDDFVKAYESAQLRDGNVELADFLPEAGHPLYLAVLRELVRADLEYAWEHEHPKPIDTYQDTFPELFEDPESLQEIAFEEYRLRQQAGENPSPEDYARRFGIETAQWPCPQEGEGKARRRSLEQTAVLALPPSSEVEEAAQAYRQFCRQHVPGKVPAWEAWRASYPEKANQAQVFQDLHGADPQAASRLAAAVTTFPKVGSTFLGFQLLAELGRGAFGRVYLAQQPELAQRHVVLKISTDLLGESQVLAQLQHTNIVPIYSIHHVAPFQAVCMPYLGATTLRDVLHELGSREALPASGKGLVSTLQGRKSVTLRGSSLKLGAGAGLQTTPQRGGVQTDSQIPQAPPVEGEALAQPGRSTQTLKMLEGFTYIRAVLWMASRLADGLAHAHERGILHRDLKPANILLTEEGEPMLLDFNLSEDTKLAASASAAFIGGTLPYMAPEHLRAYVGEESKVDARSDLYSCGMILYELLTRRHPFDMPQTISKATLGGMIEARLQQPPLIRPWNQDVSPAVEAIVRHCLEPDPNRRYQSARELQEDLDRQVNNLPLKHAPEPSLRERTQKFYHRHQRGLLRLLLVTSAVVLIGLTLALMARKERLGRMEARSAFQQLQGELNTAEVLLNAPAADRKWSDEGTTLGHDLLERYQVLENPAWQEQPAVRRLEEYERQELRNRIGDLLFFLASTTTRDLNQDTALALGKEKARSALRLNTLAEACYTGSDVPSAVWAQRADLYRHLGQHEEAEQFAMKAKDLALFTVRDRYLLAGRYIKHGQLREALPLLRELIRRNPQHFHGWLALGNCCDRLAQHADAVACYNACLALEPKSPWPYLFRGTAYLHLQDYDEAVADLSRALELRPSLTDALINRALAKHGRKDYRRAIDDLSSALEQGAPYTRVYFMRARLRDLAGDHEGARKDREEGLQEEPKDDLSWVARGMAQLALDPAAALADIDRALKFNPRCFEALQDKAVILEKMPGGLEEAIAVLDRAVKLYPDAVLPRSGRGVLLARLQKHEAARRDAEEALLRDTRPPTLYQVAGIYALTSRQNPDDRREALRLLSSALQKGFGLDVIDQDPDLDPIRDAPEFVRIVNAARALRASSLHRVQSP